MLVELQVENFRSFRDLQRFSLVASADTDHPGNTIAVPALGSQRLLRSAVLYGANAAGKSTLIQVFDFLEDFVTPRDNRRPGAPIPVQPFLLDPATREAPTTIEVTFIKEGVRYQYGFTVDRRRVHEEWLLAYPKRTAQQWFRRTQVSADAEPEWHFGPGLRGGKERLAALTKPDTLFLTAAVQFTQPQLQVVYDWFDDDMRVITAPQLESAAGLEEFNYYLMRDNPHIEPALQRLLRVADLGITGLVVEQENISEAMVPPWFTEEQRKTLLDEGIPITRLRHGTKDDPEGGVLLSMENESLGTRRLYRLGGPLWIVLRDDAMVAIDELDASLHPELVRWVVRLFQSPARPSSTAQLLFNTHDTTLLDAGIFRRDQIWFVEKDRGGASHLYPLLDYKPRKGEALGKGYLGGRYGALPYLDEAWLDAEGGESPAAHSEALSRVG